MKSFSKLIGTLLSGIGALTGISVLMNACNEEQDNKPVVEVTVEKVQQCCGTDQMAPEYPYCVNRYIYTGNCITSASLQNCCGSNNNDDYTACVNDYIKTGSCSGGDHSWHAIPAYGMPDPSEEPFTQEDIEDCCGKDDGSSLYRECANQFEAPNEVIFCFEDEEPIDDLPTVYGPVPIACCRNSPEADDSCANIFQNTGICPDDHEGLEECCGGVFEFDMLNDCVNDYLKSGLCPSYPEPQPPVYGMPDDPDE